VTLRRRLWPLLVLLSIAGAAGAEEMDPADEGAPRVRAIRFEGTLRGRTDELRARVDDLAGQPATEARLVDAVRRLESVAQLGGLDVTVHTSHRGRLVDVVFRADGEPRHLAALRLTTRAQGKADNDESWRLARQVQAAEGDFASGEGKRYHPYLLHVDADRVLRFYRRRGHRDAEVRTELLEEGDLITATLRASPGPVFTVSAVRLEGIDEKQPTVLDGLETKADAPLVVETLAADAERVRGYYCSQGYADVAVEAVQAPADGKDTQAVAVTFRVKSGTKVHLDTLRFVGDPLSDDLVRDLPVRAGGPYCPDRVSAAEDRIYDWLRERGHPDATIDSGVLRKAAPGPGKPATADVTFEVHSGGQVRVERIWFEGNTVTREEVMRQLLAIEEGDVLRQSAVDASVQALRRSDLFQSASVRVINGSRPDTRYLLFTVDEASQFSIDLLEQTLTFRNLDLADWPESVDDVANGVALRGRGQQLRFYSQSDWQGVRFLDRYVGRYVLARVELYRQTDDVGPAQETWFTLGGGVGLQAFENRISLLPTVQLEYTTLDRHDGFESLPIVTGDTFTTAVGLEGRVDLDLRDAERIPYLGFDVSARGEWGLTALGGDLGWKSVDATARLHLPLGANDHDQHYVLRLVGTFAHVAPDQDGRILAHLLPTPDIRGYDSGTIGLSTTLPGGDEVVLGGMTAATASAELRMPIPIGRRNAFGPFFDVATVGGDDDPFFAHPHMAVGAALYFSLFSERLEGSVHVAYPLQRSGTSPSYVGGGLGGSF
jgi:outer membrane protein assembly factor BamA